jgi:hypothetical protein
MGKFKSMTKRDKTKVRTVIRKLEHLRHTARDMFVQDQFRRCVELLTELVRERREEPTESSPPDGERNNGQRSPSPTESEGVQDDG